MTLIIALARTLEFISQGQIEQARRFSGIAQAEQDRAQEAAFEPAKWIDVTQEDCGSQALVRLGTNLASRSDSTIRDIKIKYTDAVANFDENALCNGLATSCDNNKCCISIASARPPSKQWRMLCTASRHAQASHLHSRSR